MTNVYTKFLSKFINSDVLYLTQATVQACKNNENSEDFDSDEDQTSDLIPNHINKQFSSKTGKVFYLLLTRSGIYFLENLDKNILDDTLTCILLSYSKIKFVHLDCTSNLYMLLETKGHKVFGDMIIIATDDRKIF